MRVAMMLVREVPVDVAHWLVTVTVRVGNARRWFDAVRVGMAVVLIMDMRVFMLGRLVPVLVRMRLRQVEPHTEPHQHSSGNQRPGDGLPRA